MHEMEGAIEARGRAAFPGLDVVSRGQRSWPLGGLTEYSVCSWAGLLYPRASRLIWRTGWNEVGRGVYPLTMN